MSAALVAVCSPLPEGDQAVRAKTLLFAPPEQMPIHLIRARVQTVFRVTVEELNGRDRHKSIAGARHVYMWLVRNSGPSFPEIGRLVGYRDHTTVMSACKRVEGEIAKGTHLGQTAAALELERRAWGASEPKSDPCAALRAMREAPTG